MFFDAEDQVNIADWPLCVGASYMAQRLVVEPRAVVVLDMVGSAEQRVFWDRHSDGQLTRLLWAIASDLGYETQFVPQYKYAALDDHVPFSHRGLVTVSVMDLDYSYWHTTEDTPDKVDPESLQRIGRVLQVWLEGGG